MMVTSAGTDNTTGLFLGSVMVTVTNVGNVTVPTPWTITIANPYYLGVSQVLITITTYCSFCKTSLLARCSEKHLTGT